MFEARSGRGQRQQRRLLDVHDASLRPRGEAGQVSDLFDGLGAGDEKEWGRTKVERIVAEA